MGIKELNPMLKKYAENCVQESDLCFFKGKRVAIDTSIYLYKYLYGNGNFLEKFLQQIVRLRLNQITPIYIFDGKPPPEKSKEILSRQTRKNNLKDRLSYLNVILEQNKDDEALKKDIIKEINKTKLKVISVTKDNIDSLKYFFDILNIKYIQSTCEADIICSNLCKNGIVDMVLSDDMDLLVSGAKILLRGFSVNSNKIIAYNVEDIKKTLKLTTSQWIDFCILCGCDYLKRIKGMGANNSYKLILKHKNIETIILNETGDGKKYKLPEDYDYQKARDLFNSTSGYLDIYNSINVCIESLYDNQLRNIKKYLEKTTKFTNDKINQKISIIYGIDK